MSFLMTVIERDRKFYLKHYSRKRLFEKHDFTPEEK